MNHLSEEWLFGDEPLTNEEERQLAEHLDSCPECRQLAAAWREVESTLRYAGEESAAPGFATRWQQRLEADRLRMYRRQSLLMLAFSLGGAMLLLGSLVIVAWPLISMPKMLLWAWLYRALTLISVMESVDETVGQLFHSASMAIPPIGWVILAGLLTEMAVLWVVSFRVLTNPRRVSK